MFHSEYSHWNKQHFYMENFILCKSYFQQEYAYV